MDRLALQSHAESGRGAIWTCQCQCGRIRPIPGANLTTGKSKGCRWCSHVRHGEARRSKKNQSAEYRVWDAMKQRCHNPSHTHYKYYGGRGIKVCRRWRNSFANFLADMGRKPTPKHTIDRFPDNDGDYKPNNCRWATRKQQAENRRPRYPVRTL